MNFAKDDWRLTAYALGELDASDASAVERLLADDESARQAVREIRRLAGLLSHGAQSAPELKLTDEQRQGLLSVADAGAHPPRARWVRRWGVPAAAAAAVLLAVAMGWLIVAARQAGRRGARPDVVKKGTSPAPGPREARTPDPNKAMETTPGHRDSPQPQHVGTPQVRPDEPVPPVPPADRGPSIAQGTRNLALDKPVTSSCEPFNGILDWVTDGEKEAYSAPCLELGKPGLQWVQIDLRAACEVYAIVLWHNLHGRRAYHDVIVQVSDDPAFASGVHTVFNNDQDNSTGLGAGRDRERLESQDGLVIDARRVRGRYVRLYSNGSTTNDRNHYVEVEVYGRELLSSESGK